jgi:hypothetical protein
VGHGGGRIGQPETLPTISGAATIERGLEVFDMGRLMVSILFAKIFPQA